MHQLANGLFQIIDAAAHLIDTGDDRIRHRLEATLHLREQILHKQSQVEKEGKRKTEREFLEKERLDKLEFQRIERLAKEEKLLKEKREHEELERRDRQEMLESIALEKLKRAVKQRLDLCPTDEIDKNAMLECFSTLKGVKKETLQNLSIKELEEAESALMKLIADIHSVLEDKHASK